MQVRVKLVGVFKINRFRQQVREYPDEISVMGVVESLGLPQQILGIALINGVHADFNAPLQDGDELTLMPVLDGG